MVMEATFDRATPLRMRVNVVSSKATLVAKADGNVFWQKTFVPGPGTGEWKQENFVKEWNTYQNVYDRDYEAIIPAGSKRVELAVTEGDWLTLSEIAVTPCRRPRRSACLASRSGMQPVAQLVYDAKNRKQPFAGSEHGGPPMAMGDSDSALAASTAAGSRCDGWRIRLPQQDTS